MKFMIDIDNTICISKNSDYHNSTAIVDRINHFNQLFDRGHEIHYWTARGQTSGIDWSELTTSQMNEWRVKYTSLQFNKPAYDIWIDDKAINVETYFENTSYRT